MRRAMVVLAALLASGANARAEPWAARPTDFGLTAVGEMKIAPGTPASQWNVLAVGLFCGTRAFNSGKPSLYLYGISHDRMANGKPVRATLKVDGADTDLSLRMVADAVAAPVTADLVRSIMTARTVAVYVSDYVSPNADMVDMTGARPAIERALRRCLKP